MCLRALATSTGSANEPPGRERLAQALQTSLQSWEPSAFKGKRTRVPFRGDAGLWSLSKPEAVVEAQRQERCWSGRLSALTQCRQPGAFSPELLLTLPGAPEAGARDSVIYPDGNSGPVPGDAPALGGKMAVRWRQQQSHLMPPSPEGLALGGADAGVHTGGVRGGGYNRGAGLLGSPEGPRSWEGLVPSTKEVTLAVIIPALRGKCHPVRAPRVIVAGAPGSDVGLVPQAGVGAHALRRSLTAPGPS